MLMFLSLWSSILLLATQEQGVLSKHSHLFLGVLVLSQATRHMPQLFASLNSEAVRELCGVNYS